MTRKDVTLREGGSYLRGYYDTAQKVACVQNLIVSSATRREGIGTRLYEQFIETLSQCDISLVFLEVFRENKVGITFWKGKGFNVVGVTEDEYYECEARLVR